MDGVSRILQKFAHLRPIGFWPGFGVGLVYFSYIFWWFWSVHSLLSVGIGIIPSSLVILMPFIITVVGMSLFWGLFSCAVFNFFKKIETIFLPFFYASTFVLLEYLRAWFFGILWAGKESLLGPHWTFGNLAYLLVGLGPIRQLASYWGIYGIDFLITFWGIALFLLIKFWPKGPKITLALEVSSVVAILILINFALPIDKFENKGKELTVSIIQTKNPIKTFYKPEELLADLSEKNRLLKEASKKSDLVVFPESTDFSKTLSGFLDFTSTQKYFNNLTQKSILIIDSNRISEQEGLKSKVIFIDSKEGVVGFYDKKLLTPGGEFLPYLAKLPLLATEYLWKNDFISSGTVFSSGTKGNMLSYQNNKIKLLVCSDIISPNLLGGEEFNFMLNLNNLAIFNGSSLIEHELLSMARFRAAENNKYLAISSNFGHSYVINHLGNIIDSTSSTGYQILTKDIVPNQTRTWYNKSGDIPILILSFLIVLIGLKTTKSREF